MSGSLHQGGYCFPNAYERSMAARRQGDWNIAREQGFEAPSVYDGTGGMLPEIIGSTDVLDDQIQASFRWQQKQQLPGGVDELPFNNLQVKASESSYNQGLAPGFHLPEPPQFVDLNHDSARLLEGQGLSLSLSCPEAGELGKLNLGNGELYSFHGQEIRPSYNNQSQIGHVESARNMNLLRNSQYVKAGQELLEEFCSVGRGQLRNKKFNNSQESRNPNLPTSNYAGSSSSSKEHHSLSPSERTNCQRRKIKLLSMLEEVDARYSRYCEQMQAVVFSFDRVAGQGAANLYTGLARKAMSRHFRVMKDAIMEELKACYEALGEKDGMGFVGLTKGETPRLRLVEKEYRQQVKALQYMVDGDHLNGGGWRPPHRGLPQRSVDLLRAWLFEHFLHPYPSETDKHVLSRQTGLSKYQVSNWFINARVRLWKPMVEEMYQQELCGKVQADDASGEEGWSNGPKTDENCISSLAAHTPISLSEKDPSEGTNIVDCRRLQAVVVQPGAGGASTTEEYVGYRGSPGSRGPGEVSLTLGLRRTENVPRMGKLSVRDI